MITLAQSTPLRGWRQAALMVAGAWVGVGAGVTIKAALAIYASLDVMVREHVVDSLASNSLYLAWEYAAIGTAVALFYAARERESALNDAAREAELERAQVLRRVTESRLAVLRARIEPEFLFGTLDRIRGLYPRQREIADAMVDALIVYLRAALPQMRGGPSSVAREVDLANSYLLVLRIPRGDALATSIAVDDACADLPFPPMVLLPLLQAAFAGADADARSSVALTASADHASVKVTIVLVGGRCPPGWSGNGPETVKRTLSAFHGDTAGLEFASSGARHRASVTVLREDQAPRVGEAS
jgi:LytS/YehU family sensor histidine kinase